MTVAGDDMRRLSPKPSVRASPERLTTDWIIPAAAVNLWMEQAEELPRAGDRLGGLDISAVSAKRNHQVRP